MGRVEDANFNIFSFAGNDDSGVSGDETINLLLTNQTDSSAAEPDAYRGNLFYEQGRTQRFNLFAANGRNAPNQTDETNAVGGANRLTADSSPSELLRDARVRAMLDVLGYAEGTGDNYGRVVFGRVIGASDRNQPFDRSLVGQRNVVVSDFSRHPNLLVRWRDGQPPSSAAGRYQFLRRTWDGLNMPDFSPRSQDLAAIKLMQGNGMMAHILRGDFQSAINAGSGTWASLPKADGNGTYPEQNARSLNDLRGVFNRSLRRYRETQTPSSPNTNNTNNVLARGRRGRAVDALQDKLIALGLMTERQKKTGPGIFGPRTQNAVEKFQKAVGLSASGRFDNATQNAMSRILTGKIKRGAQGAHVLHLQQQLVRLGYITQAKVNTGRGIFGPKTDAALRQFQREHNLTADGIFGAKTFRAMQAATPRNSNNNNTQNPPVNNGRAPEYERWNVYSTGHRPARLADGYEDLQPHHDYQSVNYVMRGLTLRRRLEARDIVLTRVGESNYGQRVPSPMSGKVIFAGDENDDYGKKVVIRNDRTGQIVMLAHFESLAVRRGEIVSYGQRLGEQGSTGNSSGAHIHINADASVIKRWVADLADGKFDGVRARFNIGRRP